MKTISNQILLGILLAVAACIIWSGNFIIARAIIHRIPPISLSFFRWLTGTLILLPFFWKQLRADWPVVLANRAYFFWTALSGITLFNTFVYLAGHHTAAINLALIGTTSSPIMAIILARIFLGEKLSWQRVTGLIICITGILLLLLKGNWHNLFTMSFGKGEGFILLGALSFAIYNILVRKKPEGIQPFSFLLLVFGIGTILLVPGFIYEQMTAPAIEWDGNMFGVIAYLGLGTSVISYLCWNAAIGKLGAARTALFGNLIPLFSSFEALWILHEKITPLHLISSVIIIIGLLLANMGSKLR